MTVALKPIRPVNAALDSTDGLAAVATLVGGAGERVARAWGGVVNVLAALLGAALVLSLFMYALSYAVLLLSIFPYAPVGVVLLGGALLVRLTWRAARARRSG